MQAERDAIGHHSRCHGKLLLPVTRRLPTIPPHTVSVRHCFYLFYDSLFNCFSANGRRGAPQDAPHRTQSERIALPLCVTRIFERHARRVYSTLTE